MNRLNMIDQIPDAFFDISYRDIKDLFESPTLIHLKGVENSTVYIYHVTW